jgi:hypothetical protein
MFFPQEDESPTNDCGADIAEPMLPLPGNTIAVGNTLEHLWKDHFLIPISITATVWDVLSDLYMAYVFFAAGEVIDFVAAVFFVVPGMVIQQLLMISDDAAFGGTSASSGCCCLCDQR